uniref:Pyrin domain-containing protein n=1 Tax=Echeneis naucrates TaxID=173247 RepID=A0A665VSL3_ECHNA
MAAPKEILLQKLQDLGKEEFETFKWYLQNQEDVQKIPKSQLENADRLITVDLMVRTYSRKYIEVAKVVLVKMNQNDLAEDLKKIKKGDLENQETKPF